MDINVYYIQSSNVNGVAIDQKNRDIIEQLSEKSGYPLHLTTDVTELKQDGLSLVFVGGGGVEGRFKAVFASLPKPVILLSTGENNSLAASMEILSYLQQNNTPEEIIHGSIAHMAERIAVLARVFSVKEKVKKLRVGRVGTPSDWLIASQVDQKLCQKQTGITLVDIDMSEFFAEIAKGSYEENEYTRLLKSKNWHPEDTEKALEIYGALKRICQKYALDSVTVRCFDLLEPVKNTGCVALAILNAEGIYAGCEGDVPSTIAMTVMGELTKQPIFMANPSRIDTEKKEIIFAHCTLPINMPTVFSCMTHFESGLGVAFAGELLLGELTIFKCSGLLDRHFVQRGELVENLHETNLCRTQLRIHMEEGLDYFLTRSIGNHHLITTGDHTAIIEEFFRWL